MTLSQSRQTQPDATRRTLPSGLPDPLPQPRSDRDLRVIQAISKWDGDFNGLVYGRDFRTILRFQEL